jgi:hypothetical protein
MWSRVLDISSDVSVSYPTTTQYYLTQNHHTNIPLKKPKTCTCGAKMCYVCRAPISAKEGYVRGEWVVPRIDGQSCPLPIRLGTRGIFATLRNSTINNRCVFVLSCFNTTTDPHLTYAYTQPNHLLRIRTHEHIHMNSWFQKVNSQSLAARAIQCLRRMWSVVAVGFARFLIFCK